MPRGRVPRIGNAASVRRRLVFDDEPSENEVTFSAGECLPNASDKGHLPGHLPHSLDQLNLSGDETDVFSDLLHTNPTQDDYDEAKRNGIQDRSEYGKYGKCYGQPTLSLEPESRISWIAVIVMLLIGVVIVAYFFVPWAAVSTILDDVQVTRDANGSQIVYKDVPYVCLSGLLSCVCTATLIAVSCCGFTWIIVYFDSMKPGRIPPTPVSPSKYRVKSGHTFHLSYLVALLNGLVVFGYYLWINSGHFLTQHPR